MTKYLLITIAALVLALGGALLYARHETQQAAQATLQVQSLSQQLAQAQGRLAQVQKASKAAKAKQQAAEEELRNALDKNRSWADGRVPDDVAGSLCKYARCAPSAAGSVPKTSD